MMAVTFKNKQTGQLVSCPAPQDAPVRREQPRAHRIARFDASPDWERVEEDIEAHDEGNGDLSASDEPAAVDVRAWAKEQGLDVPARGKLSADVIDAYKAAHSEPDHPPAEPDA